jgi:gentisate 1,2-dioxygenase
LTAPSRSPLVAYRWQHTDAALHDQLALAEGLVEPNHAAVRFINPATGADALSTMRMEMHRVVDTSTAPRREAASSVWQVFDGTGAITLDGARTELRRGDLIAVPSWCSWSIEGDLDLFRFSDAPIFEALYAHRVQVGE